MIFATHILNKLSGLIMNPALFYLGSEGPGCDSQGQCMCKRGVRGARCDRCADGSSIPATGCEQLQ